MIPDETWLPNCSPLLQAWASRNPADISPTLELESADPAALGGGVGGGRQRGSAVFRASAIQDAESHNPRVAIAGASCQQHTSEGGLLPHITSFSTRSGGPASTGTSGPRSKHFHSSSSSYSPIHRRTGSRGDRIHGGSGGLVPAEAEGAPKGIDEHPPQVLERAAVTTGTTAEGATAAASLEEGGDPPRHSGRQGSSRPRRSSRSSKRSSRRRGMRPAMPAAGPEDEMRPSPGPNPEPPGHWIS